MDFRLKPKTFPIIPLQKVLNVIKCPCGMLAYPIRGGLHRCFNGDLFYVQESRGFAWRVGDVVNIGKIYREKKGESNE